jgi:hypothetical protein
LAEAAVRRVGCWLLAVAVGSGSQKPKANCQKQIANRHFPAFIQNRPLLIELFKGWLSLPLTLLHVLQNNQDL